MFDDFLVQAASGLRSDMFAGGLALGLMTVASTLLWRGFSATQAALLRRAMATVEIDNRSDAWSRLAVWLELSGALRDARRIRAAERGRDPGAPEWVPAPGRHAFWRQGRLCLLTREISEKTQVGGARSRRPMEVITLRIPFGDVEMVKAWLAEGEAELARRRVAGPRLHALQGEWWEELGPLPRRRLETVLCDDDRLERLAADIARFHGAQDWYARRGAPWRRGYLLHGPPGTGKSSAIRALATELGRDLAVLDIARPDLSNDGLRDAMAAAPRGAFLVIEDVDAAFRGREGAAGKGVSFSGLLNAIDGVAAQEGRALFLTTNHPERLDPALIRPGRVDLRLELGLVGAATAGRHFRRFFPGEEALARRFETAIGPAARLSPAAVQGWLMEMADDPEHAAAAAGLSSSAAFRAA